jgi:hypothetical protein
VPQDRSRPPGQPTWKAAAGGPAKPAQGPQYGWKPQDQAGQTGHWARRAKLAGLSLGGLGVVAVIIVLILWLRGEKGACLVIVGADPAADAENLGAPLDPYGWRGGERLAAWSAEAANAERSGRSKLTPHLADESQLTPETLRKEELSAFFTKLERRELNPLIVYFGLHGGADASGPFLFVANGERLYVRDLIQGFGEGGLKDKKVVLLFDTARLLPDPTLGVLHADFVRAFKALDGEKLFDKAPNLVAICASDAGERGWSAAEWGSTGFAQMLLRGLSGAAPSSHGSVITALNLFDYVRDQTQSWSQATRPTAQTPILLPGEGGRERADGINVTAKIGGEAGWPEPAGLVTPPGLSEHWKACKALEDGTPSPAVYTPRLWRRYRELLLRYEQMVQAGTDGAANRLDRSLKDAEDQLRGGLGLQVGGRPPQSRGNDLPLSAALGLAADGGAGDPLFGPIWRARSDWDREWDQLFKTAEKEHIPPDVLRLRFFDYLLRQATDSAATREDVEKAARLTGLTGMRTDTPRPAEAHLLVMTQKFFDTVKAGEPPVELWKRALSVRRQAEQAALGVVPPQPNSRPPHPYSEQLWPHLTAAIEQADVRRRDGEDRLFATADAEQGRALQNAAKELDEAGKQYDAVLTRAKGLRDAYAARDEALADLPLLTRWVALSTGRGATDGRIEELKDLWLNKVHPLARRLDGNDATAGVGQLAEEVRVTVGRLKEEYRNRCAELKDRSLQVVWEEVEQVLAVPPMLIDPDLRKALAENGRRLVNKQSAEWVATPKPFAAPAPDAAEAVRTARRARTVAWGRLAAAELGDIPTEQKKQTEVMDASGLQNSLARLPTLPPEEWQREADVIGSDIGRNWQLLSADADANPAPAALGRAEFRSRWTVEFRPSEGPEPATLNRQLRWQTLFVGLALRTARDHWYEAENRPLQYFQAAANLSLADAKKVVGDGTAEPPNTGPVRELLQAGELVLKPEGFGQHVNWTSETHRTLTFDVEAPKGGPGGYVTLWPTLGETKSLSVAPEDLPHQPTPWPGAKRTVHLKSTPADIAPGTVKLTAAGYFRGQWPRYETEITLNRTPDLVVAKAPPPPNAAVAVRAGDNLDLGAIAIVLDFSGSMAELPPGPGGKPREPDWKNKDSKNQQALRTLQEVLLDLPQGTPISLRLFGHQKAFDQNLYNSRTAGINPADKDKFELAAAEATGSELIYKGPVTWKANLDELRREILNKLNIEPYYQTPLLRTMIEANNDFPEDYKGTKTMLVLTDGEDNLYPKATREAEVKKRLKAAFADSDIAIQMVLFRVDKKELDDAKRQFADVEKFDTSGRIWVVEDNTKLKDQIEQALRPKLRLQAIGGGKAPDGVPRGGLPANRQDDGLVNLRWTGPLPIALYDALVLQSRQRVDLRAGDRMLVRLTRDSNRVRFGRDLLADDPQLKGRTQRGDDWVLGLPYYHAQVTAQDKQLWLTATLESLTGLKPDRDDTLQQPRPAFVWWDVAPQGGDRPTKVRIDEWSYLPAPAWNAVAAGWPGEVGRYKPAAVRAWADLVPPPAAYRVTIDAAAARLVAGEAVAEAAGEDGKVQVFASLEQWPLRVSAGTDDAATFGQPPPPPVQCLVIRVLHPDKKSVFVRPVGAAFEASEHQFFTPSAAVTAVFGPINSKDELEAKIQGRPLTLDLISVEKFKADHKPVTLSLDPAGPEQPLVYPPNLGKTEKNQ